MSGRKRVIWLQQHILLKGNSKEDILAWARSNDWQKLEVLNSIDNTVEFKAYF
jgi:SEC-C motif-containing protein